MADMTGGEYSEEIYLREKARQQAKAEFFTELEKDKAILKPAYNPEKIQMWVQDIERMVIAIPMVDEAGNPKMDENGKLICEEVEKDVLVGMKMESIDLPIPEIFTTSMTTSFLKPEEVDYIRAAVDNYMTKLNYSIRYGKSMAYHLNHIRSEWEGVLATAKSREGKGAITSKSTYSHQEMTGREYHIEEKPPGKMQSLGQKLFGQQGGEQR